ncbi:MAG TPA: hypothetical protein VL486_00205 [Verrucomicrobiae bacterium]|nr:hypothetical protein [Verrucomicrobiae bacterium]
MRTFRLTFLLCVVAAVVALAKDTNTTITIDGVTYENFRWGTVTPTTVSIFHQTGVATVPLADLPPDLQKRFGYDPKKIAERKLAETKATAPNPESGQVTINSAPAALGSGRKHPAEMMGVASVSLPLVPTAIVFVNRSPGVRRVYWLNFKGERQLYLTLKPGESGDQKTYLGHPWVVTDDHDNALGLYYPDGQTRVVTLE